MSQTPVNVGGAANDGTGDSLRAAFLKLNNNDADLDARVRAILTGNAFQPIDADLTAIAALTTTAFGRSLLTLANGAAGLSALGAIGPGSPALTGTPTAPTAATGTSTTQIATTGFVAAALSNLLNGAPAALDTLKELADAINDDANFAATVTAALALKAPLASPSFTGTPQAPTPAVGTNTTQVATAAMVTAAVAGAGSGSTGTVMQPQGRLTLTSGAPTLISTVSAATSVLYTPAVGNLVPIWNGSAFTMTAFTETTQALSDATKSPSAAAASNVYDLFAWSDGGTIRVTRGPAWSAGTSGSNLVRGTGTGSTALTRVSGLLVNAVAITNGPAAGYGTYVGTIATDAGGATVTFNTGSAAGGGGAATIGLWNAYSRVTVRGQVRDTTTSWNYGQPTWRAMNGSASNRVTFVAGLQEDHWRADYDGIAGSNTTGNAIIGVGFNTTTAVTGVTGFMPASTPSFAMHATATVQPLGSSYLSALEYTAAGTSTYTGATGAAQTGLTWEGRY